MTQSIYLLLWYQMTSPWRSQIKQGCDVTDFKPFWLTATNLFIKVGFFSVVFFQRYNSTKGNDAKFIFHVLECHFRERFHQS